MNTESQEGTEINSYQLKKVIPVSSKYTLVEGGSKTLSSTYSAH